MNGDFYEILGLTKCHISEQQLKQAYKKAALKHHPDKNQDDKEAAEERFKQIAAAYAVLSDPQQKAVYDQHGEEGLRNAHAPSSTDFGMDAHELFTNLFGVVGKPDERVHELLCTLDQMDCGGTRNITVTRELFEAQSGGTVHVPKVFEVVWKAGCKDGYKIVHGGQGDYRPNKTPQDCVFVVKQAPHPHLERRGDDLYYTATVAHEQAAKGVKVTVPTLNGRSVLVERPGGIRNKSIATFPGEGVAIPPNWARPSQAERGNLVVQFEVQEKVTPLERSQPTDSGSRAPSAHRLCNA